MSTEIINGARNFYGPRETEKKAPAKLSTLGATKELIVDFDYLNLPGVSAEDAVVEFIPAYAQIKSVRLGVQVPFVGGTSLAVGTAQYDGGGVVDADGLITAAAAATANIDAKGDWLVGGGAQVGLSVGAEAVAITVTATGTFTAGAARLIVEYVELGA